MYPSTYLKLRPYRYVNCSLIYTGGVPANLSVQVTVNLKKVELPVKQIVSGKKIKPSGTLLNPESLEFYYQFAEVEKMLKPQAKL